MMLFTVLAPAALLFAGAASAQSESTGQMRILPITTTGPLGPPATPTVSDSGIMSIPIGETPLTTGLSITGGGSSTPITTSTPTVPPTSGGSGSASGSAAASSPSPAAAPALFSAGDGTALFAVAVSGMSIVLGAACVLL